MLNNNFFDTIFADSFNYEADTPFFLVFSFFINNLKTCTLIPLQIVHDKKRIYLVKINFNLFKCAKKIYAINENDYKCILLSIIDNSKITSLVLDIILKLFILNYLKTPNKRKRPVLRRKRDYF